MSDKMDTYLSGIYGTGSGASNDLEKTAQAELLEKLANEEGIDLSGLSEEEMEMLSAQVQADDGVTPEGGEAATDGAGGGDGNEAQEEEEAQAKFAEADFLGRVMAHAYTQELGKIAGENPFPPKDDDKKKCKDCGKEPCECPKKEASGPLSRAIQKLGGVIEETEDQRIEKRAEEMAVNWLKENGYAQK